MASDTWPAPPSNSGEEIRARSAHGQTADNVCDDIQWPGRLPEVMPLLLGGDQLVNGAPRTAKAAMERAMRQTCPNANSSLLDNLFNGNEAVDQCADSI